MRKGFSWLIMIFVAAGIIFLWYGVVWGMDQGKRIAYGKCWVDTSNSLSDFESKLSRLTPTQTDYAKVRIGDCVGGVVIFPRDYFKGKTDELSVLMQQIQEDPKACNAYAGYKSYIVVLPWKTLKEQAEQKDASWWSTVKGLFSWKTYTDAWKKYYSQMLLTPKCIGVEKEFYPSPYYLPQEIGLPNGAKNLNEKTLEYCFEIRNDGTYRFKEEGLGKCP
jgi:hypothetical protein